MVPVFLRLLCLPKGQLLGLAYLGWHALIWLLNDVHVFDVFWNVQAGPEFSVPVFDALGGSPKGGLCHRSPSDRIEVKNWLLLCNYDFKVVVFDIAVGWLRDFWKLEALGLSVVLLQLKIPGSGQGKLVVSQRRAEWQHVLYVINLILSPLLILNNLRQRHPNVASCFGCILLLRAIAVYCNWKLTRAK